MEAMITLIYPFCWGSISVIIAAIFSDFLCVFEMLLYLHIYNIYILFQSCQIVCKIISI